MDPIRAAPKKVLYLVPTLASGGTERQLAELIRHLDRSRFAPMVALIYAPKTVPIEIPLPNCPVVSLKKPLGKMGNLVALFRLWRLIRAERPDILQSFLRPADLYLRLAGPLAGHRLLVTSLRTRIVGFWSLPWQWVERVLWRLSRVVVANSAASAEEAHAALGIPWEHLRVIENGVDLNEFTPVSSPASARRELGFGAKDRVMGMVARYSPVKDHLTLLRAVKILWDERRWPAEARLLLVGGTTYSEARSRVEQAVQSLGLEEICVVRGVVPDVRTVYRALEWLVLPSRYESFPNTVLEAMACGVPVVASDAANTAGVVHEGETGWVFPAGNAELLAKLLGRALDLPALERAAMSRAARAEVASRYAASRMAQRYAMLYDALLASK